MGATNLNKTLSNHFIVLHVSIIKEQNQKMHVNQMEKFLQGEESTCYPAWPNFIHQNTLTYRYTLGL